MTYFSPIKVLRTAFFLAIFVFVTACSSGGDSGGTNSLPNSTVQHAISGSVGDGPIRDATITVKNANDTVILSTTGDAAAHYSLSVPADTIYPLILTATGGIDMVSNVTPEFDLLSTVISPGDQTANITPFSTFIVKIAQALPGGLTAENMSTAKAYVISQLNFGFDDSNIADPISTPIDMDNIANIVKSSEALAEMIRRVHAAMLSIGSSFTQNEIIEMLARDLSDGKIDGRGVDPVDARLAAMATIASAEVLLEALRNELQVGNSDASSAMDDAIKTVLPGAVMTTADVSITERMLKQATLSIDAAQVVAPSSALETLSQTLNDIAPGSSAAQIQDVLDAGINNTLASVLQTIGEASDEMIETVNRFVREENSAPIISGTPATMVVAASNYLFTPSGNDPDGDTLTFSISNKPGWAGFNTDTGVLMGTPSNGDVGTTPNIVISVSDGVFTDALPAFSITVNLAGGGPSGPIVISDTLPTNYIWEDLQEETLVFIDRAFKYTNVPSACNGLKVLRTGNGDKASSATSTLISFAVNQGVSVYVAYDTRILAARPAWLSAWEDTGNDLEDEDTNRRLYRSTFAAGTVTLGGNGNDHSGGYSMYTVLVAAQDSACGDGNGGPGNGVVPVAVDDSGYTTDRLAAITIPVLDNDSNLEDTPLQVAIFVSASSGSTEVLGDNQIRYTPKGSFVGSDSFTYKITDADGDIGTAKVTIEVTCASCVSNVTLMLNWDANPTEENILAYKLYYGNSAGTINTLFKTLTASDIDLSAPVLDIDAGTELLLENGDMICFQVSASNSAGDSERSTAECGTI
ncbi:hypothetical protein MNBD_NITROSPIRAE01-388 [hydrothermal vent metagenome]|uniref:Dystroglycan-type cadherin-like domain-containing protein n=1 Tax=hydrothermal vent metagenome TaxID=652676 RepID=A0A3B1D6X9_9ZZZZ